ncbi:MAG: STAS domain-containing protein [Spirochaetes bacterium]|nr:STAS domain-containing protein [Spirochaetota bacterium]
MFAIETERQDDVLIARIKGDATIDHAKEIQQRLISAMNEDRDIVLDLNDIDVADISFMQIISAAHMLLLKRKRNISFCSNRASPAVVDAAKHSGFFAHRRCSVNGGCNCIMHDIFSV